MTSFLNIGFFLVLVFFLNILAIAHYHWARFAQPGLRAKIFTYTTEGLAFVFLLLAVFFFYFH